MISEKLKQAREYEEKYRTLISEEARPRFHVTGGIGWINDPNGFSVYKGEYHLFYQYHPYSTKWGPMHWGHVKTKDFVKWERLPVAMAPDTAADEKGCFSGSAIELPDGRQLLMYTGVYHEENEDGILRDVQQQCIAVGDGVNYEKYENNPVIDSSMLPAGGSKNDFRDPKIWEENGTYYAVIGNLTEDGSGAVLMYESPDGFHWNYSATIDRCYNEYGKMWECPDFFSLDGSRVLVVSPQEMQAIGMEFHVGHCTAFFIGEYDEAHHFERKAVQAVDYGLDFYAPQTLLAPDGRRIMIAWMQNWTSSNCRNPGQLYLGEMTFPRELTIRNGRVCQLPVREIERYYGRKVVFENVLVHGVTTLPGVSGRVIDMTVKLKPANEEGFNWFRVNVAKDGENVTVVRYKPKSRMVRIDRSRCGFPNDIVHIRDFLVNPVDGELTLRILMDRHSLELFVNNGEQAATMMVYTEQTAQSITFDAEGDVLMSVVKYDLEFEE
ncbi:MAG: glycoside hydrolase family 32 protein [Muribaculaceae bacterium]|nr:glycoside hydrolase family 32 protein [Roseburia sp.]MCM1430674.1 glycoside hydrolase family 32 protein [Muribaculaceae bacterium]MCM1491941.1 glycoside hydrolase family 32 protein [Muribaculaceae bacterium]